MVVGRGEGTRPLCFPGVFKIGLDASAGASGLICTLDERGNPDGKLIYVQRSRSWLARILSRPKADRRNPAFPAKGRIAES